MKREDYVVVFIQKERDINSRVFCNICKKGVRVLGSACPCMYSQCSYENSSNPMKFNNKIHDVIATKEFCRGRSIGCRHDCAPCVLTNTFHVEVM